MQKAKGIDSAQTPGGVPRKRGRPKKTENQIATITETDLQPKKRDRRKPGAVVGRPPKKPGEFMLNPGIRFPDWFTDLLEAYRDRQSKKNDTARQVIMNGFWFGEAIQNLSPGMRIKFEEMTKEEKRHETKLAIEFLAWRLQNGLNEQD